MADRLEKWKNKLRGSTRKQRYDAQKKAMCRKEKDYFLKAEELEKFVKNITDGCPVFLMHFYYAFAEEIAMLAKKCQAQTLINEIEIRQQKWIKRGLDWQLLDTIKKHLVQEYKKAEFFRLDISLLDGSDRLA